MLFLEHKAKESAQENNENMVLKSENDQEQTPYAFPDEQTQTVYLQQLEDLTRLMAGKLEGFTSQQLSVPKCLPFENPEDKLALLA